MPGVTFREDHPEAGITITAIGIIYKFGWNGSG